MNSHHCNIVQPNGRVKKIWTSDEEKQKQIVQELLDRWSDYCDRNWISDNADEMFSPERKVKLF